MVRFNPINVLQLLLASFNILNIPDSPITHVEVQVHEAMKGVLYDFMEDASILDVEEDVILEFESPDDIPEAVGVPESTDDDSTEVYETTPSTCTSEVDPVDFDYKARAVAYWKSGAQKPLRLQTVQHRFRKVTSTKQLRRWEIYVEHGGTVAEKWDKISEAVLNKFQEAVERRLAVHDIDIARWGLQAAVTVGLPAFRASTTWVRNFKKAHDIVSRKITKIVTSKAVRQEADLLQKSHDFVEKVKEHIARYGAAHVYNSDQSGFELELHSGRTLAVKGSKSVEGVVQSVSATTHRYTIQPLISADGRLLSPLFLVLKESSGELGPRVQETMFRPRNVFVTASKSGKLTQELLRRWLSEVYFPNVGSTSVLLLDSWSAQCPTFVQQVVAETQPTEGNPTFVLHTIPPGTTPYIQPLDVYGFRLWKNFVRHFSDTVLLLDFQLNLHLRDNILKLQSLVHNQFSSPRFVNLFKYAWYKSGYLIERPESFPNPVDFCFKNRAKPRCDICGAIAVITCAWCTKSLCLEHFFTAYHYCETYVSDE